MQMKDAVMATAQNSAYLFNADLDMLAHVAKGKDSLNFSRHSIACQQEGLPVSIPSSSMYDGNTQ